jgi:hypothetical protein
MNEIPQWILENLCYYDKRQPDSCCDEENKIIGINEECYCDNCFYGRTKLANYIIDLINKENEKV